MSKTSNNADSGRILRSGNSSRPSTPSSSDTSSNTGAITKEVLHDALSILRNELLDGLNKKLDHQTEQLQQIIKAQAHEIQQLKKIISGQTYRLEQLDSWNRRKQAIVFGLPENNDDDLTETVQDLVKKTGYSCTTKRDPHRIGKKGSRPRPVRVFFSTECDKKAAVSRFRDLKRINADDALKGIFMNYDHPYMTSKENQRLRKRLKELKLDYPDQDLKISKGNLYLNDTVVDQFSMGNQQHLF